ncbi:MULTISPECIES: hypothetical protein [unclassified Curtobacterium]|nr:MULTISPECIES: hypothetical protein [unclassified Curtobacterium]
MHSYADASARLRWGEGALARADVEWVSRGLAPEYDFSMKRII